MAGSEARAFENQDSTVKRQEPDQRQIQELMEKFLHNFLEKQGTQEPSITPKELRYAGQMEFTTRNPENGMLEIEYRDVVIVASKFGGKVTLTYYEAESGQALGTYMEECDNILLNRKVNDTRTYDENAELRDKMMNDLNKEGPTLQDINKAQEAEQCKTINNNMKANNETEPGKKPKDYDFTHCRKIKDQYFAECYPEAMPPNGEVYAVYSNAENKFMLVADYGEGFEPIKGAQDSISLITPQVTAVERSTDDIENKTFPNSYIPINNSKGTNSNTGIGIRMGINGIEIEHMHYINGQYISEQMRLQGEVQEKEKTYSEMQEERNLGTEADYIKYDTANGDITKESPLFKEVWENVTANQRKNDSNRLKDFYGNSEEKQQQFVLRRTNVYLERKKNGQKIDARAGDSEAGIIADAICAELEEEMSHFKSMEHNYPDAG